MAVLLTGKTLTLEEIERVASKGESVSLDNQAVDRVRNSRRVVDDILEGDVTVYGINTGFGNFSDVIIPRSELKQLQTNLIRSHAAGVGEPFQENIVRTILLLRINALATGYSGIAVETLAGLIEMLNASIHPIVPSQGSVGASGDLAPLAHIGLVLIGEGEAIFRGQKMAGIKALEKAGLAKINLQPKTVYIVKIAANVKILLRKCPIRMFSLGLCWLLSKFTVGTFNAGRPRALTKGAIGTVPPLVRFLTGGEPHISAIVS